MNLPKTIDNDGASTMIEVQRDGSMTIYLGTGPIQLNRRQTFELWRFFALPGVEDMIKEAFLNEQRTVQEHMEQDNKRVLSI